MTTTSEQLRMKFPSYYVSSHENHGDETVIIRPEGLFYVAMWLRDDSDLSFNMLMDLTVVDDPDAPFRFELVVHLYSLSRRARLRLKIPLKEEIPSVESLSPLWKNADWLEREAWDMFGISFRNHPDLRRLLMYDEFEGHPLRKDYPITQRQPRTKPRF